MTKKFEQGQPPVIRKSRPRRVQPKREVDYADIITGAFDDVAAYLI